MNNDSERHDRLVSEAYHGDWSDGPASGFAREAAYHARRLRRRRQALAGFAGAALLAVVAAMWFARPIPSARAVPKVEAAVKSVAPAYEIISDQELLAEVRDRPLLAMHDHDDKMKITVLAN